MSKKEYTKGQYNRTARPRSKRLQALGVSASSVSSSSSFSSSSSLDVFSRYFSITNIGTDDDPVQVLTLLDDLPLVVSGGITGDLTGNASTASALKTAVELWGQEFDGSANVYGRIYLDSDKTVYIELDDNGYLHTNGSFYADGFVSALGLSGMTFYTFKDSVDSYSDLPSDADTGDVYYVKDEGASYAYNGSTWSNVGSTMSLDGLYEVLTEDEYEALTEYDSKFYYTYEDE